MRTLHTTVLSFLGVLTLAATAHAELMMTRTDRVLLYQEGKVKGSLSIGVVVDTQPSQTDRRYLQVRYEDQVYHARAADFIDRRELEDELSDSVIDARTTLEGTNRDLGADYQRLNDLYAAIIHVDRDRALLYRTVTNVTHIGPGGQQVLRPTYQNESVVSSSRARRLIRDWEKEIDHLQKRVDKTWDDREDAMAKLHAAEERRSLWLSRFDKGPGADSIWVDYVVTRDRARLYVDQKVVAELPQYRIVEAYQSQDYQGWLIVKHPGGQASLRSSEARPLSEWRLALLGDLAEADITEHRIQEELQIHENRRNLLRDFGRQLAYYSKLGRQTVIVTGGGMSPGFGEVYVVNAPISATVAVNVSRARHVIDDWQDDLKAVDERIDDLRKALAKTRKTRARLERDLRDLGVELPAQI